LIVSILESPPPAPPPSTIRDGDMQINYRRRIILLLPGFGMSGNDEFRNEYRKY
jgi:hypothetical protein